MNKQLVFAVSIFLLVAVAFYGENAQGLNINFLKHPQCLAKFLLKNGTCPQPTKETQWTADNCCKNWDSIACFEDLKNDADCSSAKADLEKDFQESRDELTKQGCDAKKFGCKGGAAQVAAQWFVLSMGVVAAFLLQKFVL